jgi:predicted ThiF/HesA family dinucleotide-utilizing enzyme
MHAAFPITVASVATVAYAVFAVWTELSRKRAATRLSVASATSPSGGGSAIGPLVIIIGLGGVGSHTANLLLRGGVRRLRLIDFDQVTLSSLNRNATAVRADVGTPKVVALREQMLRVAPSAQIEAIVALFDAAAAPRLLAGEPALVVDCIDDLATKAALLGYCVREGLPVLCALGAGGKGDCCAFHVGRLSEVFNDPIAASLLKRLKKQRVEGTDDEAPTTAPVASGGGGDEGGGGGGVGGDDDDEKRGGSEEEGCSSSDGKALATEPLALSSERWWDELCHRVPVVYSSEPQQVGYLLLIASDGALMTS